MGILGSIGSGPGGRAAVWSGRVAGGLPERVARFGGIVYNRGDSRVESLASENVRPCES